MQHPTKWQEIGIREVSVNGSKSLETFFSNNAGDLISADSSVAEIELAKKKLFEQLRKKSEPCPGCGGNGFHIHDSCDHNGEHVQYETKCEVCEGSGEMPDSYKKTTDYYYTAPSLKIFNEVKEAALEIWNSYEDPYRTEKVSRVQDIKNVSDNLMYIVAMFDLSNQRKLSYKLSGEACEAIRDRMEAGGAEPYYIVF